VAVPVAAVRAELPESIHRNGTAEGNWKPEGQILRMQGEMYPPILETNTPMPGTVKEICAQQSSQIVKDPFITGWMKAMTPVVNPQAGYLETARVAPHHVPLLQKRHIRLVMKSQLPGRPEAGRSGA
jgi:hypothetical protein